MIVRLKTVNSVTRLASGASIFQWKSTWNWLRYTQVLPLLVLWTIIVYSYKDSLQVFIYMTSENRQEDLLCIIILEWVFYISAPLSIYLTPPFKIHPTVMRFIFTFPCLLHVYSCWVLISIILYNIVQ